MAKFIDGPAHGKHLMLRRAPIVLRVVINRKFEIDALDQPGDEPESDEDIYLYRIKGKATYMHLCVRGKNRASGGVFYEANYVFVKNQPSQDEMQGVRWQSWCEENREKVLFEYRSEESCE